MILTERIRDEEHVYELLIDEAPPGVGRAMAETLAGMHYARIKEEQGAYWISRDKKPLLEVLCTEHGKVLSVGIVGLYALATSDLEDFQRPRIATNVEGREELLTFPELKEFYRRDITKGVGSQIGRGLVEKLESPSVIYLPG